VAPAAAAIRARIGSLQPEVAITLGSGLGQLAAKVHEPVRIPYDAIPGFPAPTVPGHRGELVIGRLGGRVVVTQSGRFHMYEGHAADVSALPVRVFADLGVSTFVVTNAAGGIRPGFAPGTIMLLTDHLNLTGRTPLLGAVPPGEERFPDMSAAYDPGLRARARRVAAGLGIAVEEGVYAGLVGPSYETPAEIRMLATLGADAVGMSTVMEVIAARARGLRCLGISTITNAAAGISGAKLSHAEVMEVAGKAGDAVAALIEGVVGSRE
jgi:purine-nucleoside phosphorylase